MSASDRRIVITGVGAVSPIGTGNDVFWQALEAGKSGVAKVHSIETRGVCTDIAAEVTDYEPRKYVKQKKSLKVMARDIQLAAGCAEIAVEDAKLDTTQVDPKRFGVNCGAGLIASDLDELGGPAVASINGTDKFDIRKWGQEGLTQLFPLWMLKYLPNMPACHISIFYDAQGPNNTITAGTASATLATGEAFRVMARGTSDVFIVGGTDSKMNPLSIVRLDLLKRLSKFKGDPAEASRPFDADRDGLVAGEGAGMLVLEEARHARARGANIYAEIVGFGSSCHPSSPDLAIERAAKLALREADVKPDELSHVVCNGLSCVEEDRVEALALSRLLGSAAATVPVVAYKSYMGFTCAAAGALELVASTLALKHRLLPKTLNFHRPDSDSPRLRILRDATELEPKPFLTYDLSHGGQCGALVVCPYFD